VARIGSRLTRVEPSGTSAEDFAMLHLHFKQTSNLWFYHPKGSKSEQSPFQKTLLGPSYQRPFPKKDVSRRSWSRKG
jgi:hypothetical protein